MASILEIINLIAPQFEDPAVIELFIDLTSPEVDRNTWGDSYNKAVAYLTAHNMTITQYPSTVSPSSSPIRRKKAGNEEIEFFSPASDQLTLTSYGQMFLSLRKKVISSFVGNNMYG